MNSLHTFFFFLPFYLKPVHLSLVARRQSHRGPLACRLTVAQLPLLGQQEHVHVVLLLQGGGQHGPLAAEQEEEGHANVRGGVAVADHLEEGRVLAVAALAVVWWRGGGGGDMGRVVFGNGSVVGCLKEKLYRGLFICVLRGQFSG